MKIIKAIFIVVLTCFSFYYTDKIVAFSKSKDPIMIDILNASKSLNKPSKNAIISGDSITSGKMGEVVNINKTYEKMKTYGKYKETLLVFDEVEPDISINNNYDKYVVSGSTLEDDVSFIFFIENESYLLGVLKILKEYDITSYFFIDGVKTKLSDIELISLYGNFFGNGGASGIYYDKGVSYTNKIIKDKNKNNKNFCFYKDEETIDICKKYKISTIKEDIVNTSRPYKYVKENLKSGKIFVFKINNYLTRELPTIIRYINQKGYNIISLNDLLNV